MSKNEDALLGEKKTAGMKKGDRVLIVALVLIAAALFGYVYFGQALGEKGPYALISVNQRVYHTLDIGAAKDEVITYTDAGVTYTVEIKDHQICMKHIDCPDQICVHTGYTNNRYIPIICLPNKVMIVISDTPTGENLTDGEVDGIAN
ncbi:MAG TPA: NusG domain II-containing protein [Candidatus Acidoferrum sp.]|nr:NusG domain II-containing protein [Candidatus Acidoferrum sp.]